MSPWHPNKVFQICIMSLLGGTQIRLSLRRYIAFTFWILDFPNITSNSPPARLTVMIMLLPS